MTRAARSSDFRLEGTLERLGNAVEALATGEALKLRLWRAGEYIVPLHHEDFPSGDLRDRYQSIMSRLTARGPQGEIGALEHTHHYLQGGHARKIAADIVTLYRAAVFRLLHPE